MTIARYGYEAVILGTPNIPGSLDDESGKLVLDSSRAPHISGTVTFAVEDPAMLAALDPREARRLRIRVTRPSGSLLVTVREFDLGIRAANPDRATGKVAIELASDEALLDDITLLSDLYVGPELDVNEITVREVVNLVLERALGAELEPGTPDADATPMFPVTNLIRNPAVVGSTLNWAAGGGCSIAFVAAGTSGYIRVTPSAASGAVFACDTVKWNINCEPGKAYWVQMAVRAETAGGAGYMVLRFLDANNDLIKDVPAFTTTPIGVATQIIGVAATAPANAVKIAPYFRFTTNRIYRLDNALLIRNEDGWAVDYFSGGDAPDSRYSYEFQGPSNDSPSVRRPFIERAAESMVWRAGTSALAFLAPIVQSAGFRLVCDEQRRWTLRDAAHRTPGDQAYRSGVNIISAQETMSREGEEWFDGAVFRYSWVDRDGIEQARIDSFALPGATKIIERNIDAPYPGPGRAEYAVRRAQGKGRTVTVTAQAKWTEAAEQQLSILLAGTPIQTGTAERVEFDLSRNEVTVTSRTTDTPAGAWMLIPAGQSWLDSPSGASWTEEIV